MPSRLSLLLSGEVTYDPDDEKEFKQTRKGSIVTHSVSWNWFNAGYNIGGLYLEKNITYENNFKTGAYIRGASMCDWDYDETYGEKIDKDATYYVTGWGDPTVEPRSISLLSVSCFWNKIAREGGLRSPRINRFPEKFLV